MLTKYLPPAGWKARQDHAIGQGVGELGTLDPKLKKGAEDLNKRLRSQLQKKKLQK